MAMNARTMAVLGGWLVQQEPKFTSARKCTQHCGLGAGRPGGGGLSGPVFVPTPPLGLYCMATPPAPTLHLYGYPACACRQGQHSVYDCKLRLQRAIKDSGVPYTLVCCGLFMELLYRCGPGQRAVPAAATTNGSAAQ
jgi:hypothetical protein